ncbi:DUF6152 family protein [Pontibacter sp. H259]|uniref:DUF6152 family protein n=1 Tax=Pontibacter sp. H259 TaxID=3133421 RepID=UPI0030C231AF
MNILIKPLIILLFPVATLLHHGWANYDQTKTLDYTGVVQEMTYENPHGMLKLKHNKKTWTVILAPPSRMTSRGLTEDMIKVSDSVRVIGYPHKEIKNEMRAERIYVDGQKFELR